MDHLFPRASRKLDGILDRASGFGDATKSFGGMAIGTGKRLGNAGRSLTDIALESALTPLSIASHFPKTSILAGVGIGGLMIHHAHKRHLETPDVRVTSPVPLGMQAQAPQPSI